jgi:hypothetical protein
MRNKCDNYKRLRKDTNLLVRPIESFYLLRHFSGGSEEDFEKPAMKSTRATRRVTMKRHPNF